MRKYFIGFIKTSQIGRNMAPPVTEDTLIFGIAGRLAGSGYAVKGRRGRSVSGPAVASTPNRYDALSDRFVLVPGGPDVRKATGR